MADAGTLMGAIAGASTPFSGEGTYLNRDGFDQIWLQTQLQTQMATIESDIRNIETNSNLSDTEKMFSMQMAMNTWTAVSTLRTQALRVVADTLKTTVQNIGQ